VTSPVRDAPPVTPSLAADPAAFAPAVEPEPEAIERAQTQTPPSLWPIGRREALRVSWMTAERSGSGGNGSGRVRTKHPPRAAQLPIVLQWERRDAAAW
jgi:hypothetical protein